MEKNTRLKKRLVFSSAKGKVPMGNEAIPAVSAAKIDVETVICYTQ